jgi:hypothetical protein
VGSDFTTNFHEGANTVHIGADSVGWVECNVVEGACTVDCGSSKRIVCDTLTMPESWVADAGGDVASVRTASNLQFRVNVCRDQCDTSTPVMHEVRYGSFQFTSARDSTSNPVILGVEPRHLTAGGALSLTGSKMGNSIKDYRVVYVGERTLSCSAPAVLL